MTALLYIQNHYADVLWRTRNLREHALYSYSCIKHQATVGATYIEMYWSEYYWLCDVWRKSCGTPLCWAAM